MYTIYKTTNKINGRYYIGAHKTNKPNDHYMGSGLAIKRAIKYYGRENFEKTVIAVVDTEQQMYNMERELVEQHIDDPLCYNLMEGGVGGFEHINSKRHLYINPMKDPLIVKKNLESRMRGYGNDPVRIALHNEKRRENVKRAIEYNTGRKRPKQSELMKEKSALYEFWSDKEKARDTLSSCFQVVSPAGQEYKTNRLQEFCFEHGLSYVSVWNTSRTNKPVSKGSSKGWICYKI